MSQLVLDSPNPTVFLSYPWHENPAPVIECLRRILQEARFDVSTEMVKAGILPIPVKEMENLLRADAVAIILAPDETRFISQGVRREIDTAKEFGMPIFVLVDRAYTGHPTARTELDGIVSGDLSIKEWFEYDRISLLEGNDSGRLRAWLSDVRAYIQKLDPRPKLKRKEYEAAIRRFRTEEISVVQAVPALAAEARKGTRAFLQSLAENAARITGAGLGLVGVPRRTPGRTDVEIEGLWSRYGGTDVRSAQPHQHLVAEPLGYSTNHVTGLTGFVAKTGQSILATRLREPAATDGAYIRHFVNPHGLEIQSEICVPVVDDSGRVILVLDVEDEASSQFRESHREQLEDLGRIAASYYATLMNHEFSRLVISLARGEDGAARRVLEHVVQRTAADYAFIALRNREGQMRVMAITETDLAADVKQRYLQGNLYVEQMRGITGAAMTSEKIVAVEDVSQYGPDYLGWWPATRSEIALPIVDLHAGAEGIVNLEYVETKQFPESFQSATDLLAQLLLLAVPAQLRQAVGGRSLRELIDGGEGLQVEFKESFRRDARSGRPNEQLQQAVAKTVCGFLNRAGGTIVIGTSDAAAIIGIETECEELYSGNVDLYVRAVEEYLGTHLAPGSWRGHVRICVERLNNVQICRVDVQRSTEASGSPYFCADSAGGTNFYVRTGNRTDHLTGPDQVAYIRRRWGR